MHRLPGWLILAALLALTVLAFGCAGDDDDSGGDDTGDDDDDDWENDPAIQSNAVDPIDALTPAALSALEAAPEWIYYDLLETFNRLGDANQDRWANLILDASDDRYVDELAFLVAHSSLTDLMYEGYLPELLEENVASIYETAEALPYVTLIEVDDGARNDYTTLEYALPDGDTFELFRDDYLWYVVHPRLEDERPVYINPDTGRTADPPDGVFWRDYLLDHADDGYQTLRSFVENETVLWNYLNDAADNGAIGAVNDWVNHSMTFGAGSERPIQPVRIYALHKGNCGEFADITDAAARAALIPAANIAAYADDHTWNEFFDGSWHQWEPVNNMIDEPDHYDDWGGGGIGVAGVYRARGDGYTYNVTPTYSETCTVDVTVTDERGQPVEGARVVGSGMVYGMQMEHFVDWTDAAGKVSALLGDDGQYFYFQADSPLGVYPDEPEIVVTQSETDATYEWEAVLPGALDLRDVGSVLGDPGEGPVRLNVLVTLFVGYLDAESIVRNQRFLLPVSPPVRVLVLDAEQHGAYVAGEPFDAWLYDTGGDAEFSMSIPKPGTWYVVVSNEADASSSVIGSVSLSVEDAATGDELAAEEQMIRIGPAGRAQFAITGL